MLDSFRDKQHLKTSCYWWSCKRGRGCESWTKAETKEEDALLKKKKKKFNNRLGSSGSLLVLLDPPAERRDSCFPEFSDCLKNMRLELLGEMLHPRAAYIFMLYTSTTLTATDCVQQSVFMHIRTCVETLSMKLSLCTPSCKYTYATCVCLCVLLKHACTIYMKAFVNFH